MAEEMENIFCRYCDSQHTNFEYSLHRVSNGHVKRLQRSLFQRGFASVCLVCNFALKDLKHVELHVREKTHKDRMKSFVVDSYLSKDKCMCASCGITFFNEVMLEAHHLLPLHDSTTDPPNTPKLNELSRQLTGLSETHLVSNGAPFCSICNTSYDCFEDLITHLFTSAHISRVRSSSCMVCKKDFTHASDRESHLHSSKHQMTLQKCSDLLDKGRTQTLLSKGGYPCMFCMIWCNSWLCLEIHVLDKHHTKISVESKANCRIPSRIIFLAGSGVEQHASCDKSAMRSWSEWRGEASWEHVWCHRCGVILLNVDEANRHLNNHVLEKCQVTCRLHSSKLLELASSPEVFECIVCAMSFKNAFMRSLHEAGFEHHSRLAAFCSTHDVRCCSNCGLLCDDADVSGVFACTYMKETISQLNNTEASPRYLCLPQNNSFVCDMAPENSNIRVKEAVRSLKDAHQSPGTSGKFSNGDTVCTDHIGGKGCLETDERKQAHSEVNLLKVGMALGAGEPPVSISGKAVSDGGGVDSMLIEKDPLMTESMQTVNNCPVDHVTSELGGTGCSTKVLAWKKGHVFPNVAADGNDILAGKSCHMPTHADADRTVLESNKAHLIATKSLQPGASLPNRVAISPTVRGHLPGACTGLDESVLLAGQVPDGNGGELAQEGPYADLGIPVVVAATLAPVGTLQVSLQSITTIVTETLSTALASFYMQQSASLSKRKDQFDVEKTVDQPDAKRMCSERILEAALQQGLQSVCSNATGLKGSHVRRQDLAENENVRNGMEDDKDVQEPRAVFAVAASVIRNGLQNLSRPPGAQGQEVAAKAQESSAMQSADDSSKRALVSTDMKSESLSQVAAGDQGSAGRRRVKTVGEERLIQLEISPLHPSSALVCTGTQNASTPRSPLLNDAVNSVKDEVSQQAKTIAASTGVVMSHDSEGSESNDDDYYAFLDPTKAQAKWWSSSDSEDSDSVSK